MADDDFTSLQSISSYVSTSDTPTLERLKTAFVYLVAFDSDGPVKFGKTKNPRSRFYGIEGNSGRRLSHICISEPLTNAIEVEKHFHNKLNHRRLIGEWFDITYEQAEKIFRGELKALHDAPPPQDKNQQKNEHKGGWQKGRKRGHMPETIKALKLVGTVKDGKRVSIRQAAHVCGISYVTLFRAMKDTKK